MGDRLGTQGVEDNFVLGLGLLIGTVDSWDDRIHLLVV